MATWQVQQAKARLSELIDDAQTKGPQIITKHGSETAVLISIADYRSLSTSNVLATSLRDYLLDGPKFDDSENPFEDLRDRSDTGREISL
jgi:prevent-host-death family protein